MFKIFSTYILILGHPVYKVNNTGTKYVRIMKLHFKEEKTESIYHV